LRQRIVTKAFSHGLLLLGCGKSTIRIAPPLMIGSAMLDEGLQILDSSIAEAEAEGLD